MSRGGPWERLRVFAFCACDERRVTNCRLFFFVEKVFLVFLLCHFFFFLAIFWHFYRFYGRGAVVQKAVQNTHPRKKGPESFPAILLASVFFAHPFPRKKFQKKRVCTLCTISYDRMRT